MSYLVIDEQIRRIENLYLDLQGIGKADRDRVAMGTTLERHLQAEGMGWVLGVGRMHQPKDFFMGKTIQETLTDAKMRYLKLLGRETPIESLDELKQLVHEIVGPRETWDDENKDWKAIYNKIFCRHIMDAARKFNVDWCDPDTTYQDDVVEFCLELLDA